MSEREESERTYSYELVGMKLGSNAWDKNARRDPGLV